MAAPVLLIAFARPEHTKRVWERIRVAQPDRLFVAIDAPRNQGDEAARVAAVGEVTRSIDWPCSVEYLIQPLNLGPGLGPRSAISWFFANVDSGIILEDDTVPHVSFFAFASELLQRFSDDSHVMCVSGTSFAAKERLGRESYFPSRYTTTWGWATWKRSWDLYDPYLSDWESRRESEWLANIGGKEFARHWTNVFDMTKGDLDGYWDYQFQYSAWKHAAVALHPTVNLVTNIGLGEFASHTVDRTPISLPRPTEAIQFPLTHPPALTSDPSLDRWIDRNVYRTRRSLRGRIARTVGRVAHRAGIATSRIRAVAPDV